MTIHLRENLYLEIKFKIKSKSRYTDKMDWQNYCGFP